MTSIRRISTRCGLGLLAAVTSAVVLEAQVPIPAPPQRGPIALQGATIHTVTNGVIEHGTIVFNGGLITAVGTDVDVPAGARVIDVTGKHIYDVAAGQELGALRRCLCARRGTARARRPYRDLGRVQRGLYEPLAL